MATTTFGADTPPRSPQPSAASDATVAGGSPIFSKYRLIARLGSGGMAEVFLALSGSHHNGLSKLVVLKVLRPDLGPAERADFSRMFYDEGRLAMRLSHPNIVQAHEVGSEETVSFIAMEYLEGQALSAIQERGWRSVPGFSLDMQLHVLCQVLEGLEYAHALTDYSGQRLDIVHRDVSPQNVFVTYSGHTKLVDFGIAKTLDSNSKTAAGVVKGKVRYMAPEQVRCGRVDHRADLFSVGVMLWEAIARRSMHGNASLYEVVGRLVNGELPRLRDAVPNVDRHLEQVVTRALSLDPAARYEDAGALREELLGVLDGRRKVSTRELGERVARLFEPEREAIGKVIWQAMNDVPSDELLARVNAARVLAELPWVSTNSVRAPGTDRVTAAALPPTRAPGIPSFDPAAGRLGAPGGSPERDEGSGVSAHIAGALRGEGAAPSAREEGTTPLRADVAGVSARAEGATPSPRSEGAVVSPRSESSTPTSAKRRRALWLLAIGGGLVALFAAFGRPLTAEPREAVIVDMPAPTSRVRVSLQATPPSARFVLDGRALDANPYQGEHPTDAFIHTLEVSADGHQQRSIQVRLNRDLDLDVRLAEEPAAHAEAEATVAPGPSAQREAPRAPGAQPQTATRPSASAADAPAVSRRTHALEPRPAKSAPPPRRAPESVRSSPSASRSGDDIYPDEPLPAPKLAPLEGY